MIKLIILDLDGTLTPQRPSSTAPFERVLLPGVAEKCAKLRDAGDILAIASNQGGARRDKPGRLTFGAIQAHMAWIRKELEISAIRYSVSKRKKPDPAMLVELRAYFNAEEVLFVGDAETDRQASESAGIKFIHATEFFHSDAPTPPPPPIPRRFGISLRAGRCGAPSTREILKDVV